jgi:outer membrane protein TolC
MMKMKTTLQWMMRVSVALALMTSASCIAQISLSSAVDLALRNDPRVKIAQATIAKAEAVVAESKDVYIPNVAVQGGYGISSGVPLGVPVVFKVSSDALLFNFSQRDQMRAARESLNATKLALLDAQQQTAEDVSIAYMGLDNAFQRHAALLEELEHSRRLVKIVQQRLDVGQDSRMEALRWQKTTKEIELATLNTEDEVNQLSVHLALLMGLPADSPLATVPGSIPPLPVPGVIQPGVGDSVSVQAAFAAARSRQESAFGEARYRFRPQIGFGANYAYVSTSNTAYNAYYPGFANPGNTFNALSVGISLTIPIVDYEHQAHARETSADAHKALADAEEARRQFFEGRSRLRHSVLELQARADIAELDQEIAQENVSTILIQLTGSPSSPPITPKDEQNVRIAERARHVDLLSAQQQLHQTTINLLRQTGTLGDWLKQTHTLTTPSPSSH